MEDFKNSVVLIVGAGPGISACFARQMAALGAKIGLVARQIAKLDALARETGGMALAGDAADPAAVADVFSRVETELGAPDIVLYNASLRARGSLLELDPEAVARSLSVSAFGGFLVVQQAARRMVARNRGTILLTGASASVKGFAQSAPFAMGKFALRGLAQSAARELGPKGIHVAHFIIDGGVRSASRPEPADAPDSLLNPEAIARVYVDTVRQPRSAWSFETDLRPWVERF